MIIGVSGKINSGKDTVGSIIQYLTDYNRLGYTHPINEKDYREYLHNKHQLKSNWQIKKYADKLKDIVCILLSCTREQLEDRVFKETALGEEWWYYKCGNLFDGYELYNYKNENYEDLVTLYNKPNVELIKPTPRLLMQLLGTECGRNILHPNVWVNATMVDYFGSIKTIEGEFKVKGSDWIITDTRFPNEVDAVKQRDGINIRIERDDYIFDGDGERIIPTKEYVNTDNKQHESETALDNYTFDYVIDNNGTIEDLIIKVKEILIKENII